MLIFRDIANVLELDQLVISSRSSFSLQSDLTLDHSVKISYNPQTVHNEITLNQIIIVGKNISYSLSNALELGSRVSIGPSEQVTSYLQLASFVTIVNPTSSNLNIQQAVSYIKPTRSQSQLSLGSNVVVNKIRNRNLESGLELKSKVRVQKLFKGKVNLCESSIPFDLEETDNE